MTTKKRKLETQDGIENKKAHLDNIEEMSTKENKEIIIVDDIRNKNTYMDALQRIIDTGEETVLEFVSTGGRTDDLLKELDMVEKTKPSVVQIIFEAAEKFLIYGPPNFATELAHKILIDHMRYIIMFLSPTGSATHNITVLRLLTAMIATGNDNSAKDLLVKLNFEHVYFEQLFNRRASDVRKTYVYFLLSFFISQGPIILKEYIDKGGKRIAGIFLGLHEDPMDFVVFILDVLKDKLMMNQVLSKTSKMKIFNTAVLKKISDLMLTEGGWTELSDESESAGNKAIVNASVFEFLKFSLTSVKTGLIFFDESVGNSGQNRNHLLLTFLQTMKSPWESEWHEKLVITCLSKCPDQLRPYLNSLSLSSPRDSVGWYKIANFMKTLMKELDLESRVLSGTLSKKFLMTTLSNVAFPEVIIRDVVKPSLKCNLLVQRAGIDVLHDLICRVEDLILKSEKSGLSGSSIRSQLVHRFKERIPPLDDVLSFWKTEKSESGEYLCTTAKVLDFYLNFLRIECETVDSLLSDVQSLEESVARNKATLYFLKYQTLSFTVTKKFNENYIEILFNVAFGSDDENIKNLATTTLFQIFGIQSGLTKRFVEFEIFISVCREMKQSYSTLISIINSESYNLSDLNEEIFDLKTKLGPGDDAAALPGKTKLIEQFLDKIIDHDDDNIRDVILDANYIINSSQNATQFELSPLTLIFLKSYKPSMSWIMKYIKYVSYCSGNLEDFAQCVDKFIKEKELTTHFNALKFGKMNQLVKEDQVKVDSLSAFIILTKLILIHRFQRTSKNEPFLIKTLETLLLSSKNVRQSLLLQSDMMLDLFQPYSSKHLNLNRMILNVLTSNQDLISETLFKKQFLKSLKESSGLKSIDTELLKQCLTVFKYDHSEVMELLLALTEQKDFENGNWLLHFSELLVHIPKTSDHCLAVLTEVIVDVISAIISMPTYHPYLDSVIVFCNTFLCFSLRDLKLSEFVRPMLNAKSTPVNFLSYLVTNDMDSSCKTFRKIISKDKSILFSKWKTLTPLLVSLIKQKGKKKFVTETCVETLCSVMCDSIKTSEDSQIQDLIIVIMTQYPDFNLMEKLNMEINEEFIPSISASRCLLVMANESVSTKTIVNIILVPILRMYSQKLKNPTGVSKEEMEECYLYFSKFLQFDLSKVMKHLVKHKEDFWINTVRTFLKHGLKIDSSIKAHFRGLAILSKLIKFCYHEDHEHLSTIYQMVHGHSNFLSLILSTKTDDESNLLLKKDLLQFIESILLISPDYVVSEHIPLYLGAYGSTLSEADQSILSILNYHEKKHSFSSFQPIVWGPFAISRYTIGSSEKKSLWKVPRCSEILSLIDADKMYNTAVHFPIEMKLFNEDSHTYNSDQYDPRFYLPLFSTLCSPESYIDKHLKLLESGGLALALGAISSKDENMRALGYTVISRIFSQFEGTKFAKEKMIWIHFLNLIRNGVREFKDSKTSYLRIPSIVSVFLVKCVRILKSPLHYMYKNLSYFLLAKPFLDLFNVPDFLSMFHSITNANDQNDTPRKWILCVIKDGLKDSLDYHILQKVRIIRLLLSFHTSILSTNEEEIFNVMNKCLSLKEGALDLIESQGLLIWCLSRRASPRRCIQLLITSWDTISKDETLITLDLLSQFLNVIKGLLLAGHLDALLLDLLASILEASKKSELDMNSLLSRNELVECVPHPEKVINSYNKILMVLN